MDCLNFIEKSESFIPFSKSRVVMLPGMSRADLTTRFSPDFRRLCALEHFLPEPLDRGECDGILSADVVCYWFRSGRLSAVFGRFFVWLFVSDLVTFLRWKL